MIILLFSLAFSQTEKHNIKDIVEVDGLFYKNFSKEKVSGFVYQKDNDLSIPLGCLLYTSDAADE